MGDNSEWDENVDRTVFVVVVLGVGILILGCILLLLITLKNIAT